MRYSRRTLVKLFPATTLSLLALPSLGGIAAADSQARNFVAHLDGDDETPPVQTGAQGQAIFHLSQDGSALSYKLIVANIDDPFAAHIHVAQVGVAGPVVAFLYPGPAIAGRFDGVLATGTITAGDLKGPLAGHPLSDLIAAMASGNTYTNVHTAQHPGGEIRGQIH
jgi:hypothetical protein